MDTEWFCDITLVLLKTVPMIFCYRKIFAFRHPTLKWISLSVSKRKQLHCRLKWMNFKKFTLLSLTWHRCGQRIVHCYFFTGVLIERGRTCFDNKKPIDHIESTFILLKLFPWMKEYKISWIALFKMTYQAGNIKSKWRRIEVFLTLSE